jgi:Fic family protein
MYIYRRRGWPAFTWDHEELMEQLARVRHRQGRMTGKMVALGFTLQEEAELEMVTIDAMKTSEIEGEYFDREQVRSSVARKLGMDIGSTLPTDRHVDGMVEMLLDATQGYFEPVTQERLFGWHHALFPTGRSGMYTIKVGGWREDGAGPMQVVSGPLGRERVHFEAPESAEVPREMDVFLEWFAREQGLDPVLKAGIAHLWLITIHPFDDGNGRIARAVTDLQLARSDDSARRFYSMSAQIQKERKEYYVMLEKSQRGGLDITDWLQWFLSCLERALVAAEHSLEGVLKKARYWTYFNEKTLNERQRGMLNRLLDGFEGKLSTSKWAKICKVSTDTALRDIQDLERQEVLVKEEAGGRSTHYLLVEK